MPEILKSGGQLHVRTMNADPEFIAAGNAKTNPAHDIEMLRLVVDLAIDIKTIFVTQLEWLRQSQAHACAGKVHGRTPEAAAVRQHDARGTLFGNAGKKPAFIVPWFMMRIVAAHNCTGSLNHAQSAAIRIFLPPESVGPDTQDHPVRERLRKCADGFMPCIAQQAFDDRAWPFRGSHAAGRRAEWVERVKRSAPRMGELYDQRADSSAG